MSSFSDIEPIGWSDMFDTEFPGPFANIAKDLYVKSVLKKYYHDFKSEDHFNSQIIEVKKLDIFS